MYVQIIGVSDPLWLQTLQALRHDVYHLPAYLQLEAKRNGARPEAALIQEGEKIFFLPYLLRRYSDFQSFHYGEQELFDVTSPYGYPGILLSEAAMHSAEFIRTALSQLIAVWSSQKICSAFLRLHPVLNAGLKHILSAEVCQITGETVGIDLQLSKEEIWKQTRSDHRKDINRNQRQGFVAKVVSFDQYIDEFVSIYKETMSRVKAKENYYFSYDFFLDLLSLENKLHLGIVEIEKQIACACLITECCEIVQTYLGGTKQQFLTHTPDKTLFNYIRFWAKERGNQIFHLGGGVGSSKDGVYQFKAGFSKQRYSFLTLRLIVHPENYFHLVDCRAKSLQVAPATLLNTRFFPAYRESVLSGGSLSC
jgi:hypothetical protein